MNAVYVIVRRHVDEPIVVEDPGSGQIGSAFAADEGQLAGLLAHVRAAMPGDYRVLKFSDPRDVTTEVDAR